MSVRGPLLRPMPSRRREGERERMHMIAHRWQGILGWRCGLLGGGMRAHIARVHIQCTIRLQTVSAPSSATNQTSYSQTRTHKFALHSTGLRDLPKSGMLVHK